MRMRISTPQAGFGGKFNMALIILFCSTEDFIAYLLGNGLHATNKHGTETEKWGINTDQTFRIS